MGIETQAREVTLDSKDITAVCMASLDFFAAFLMPEHFKFNFPPLYKVAWTLLLKNIDNPREFDKIALGLPRGFAKTTLIKLFISYCILFTSRKSILIIAETADKATDIVHDVFAMLDESNVINTFGHWRVGAVMDTKSEKSFGYRGRNILVRGIGSLGPARGSNRNNDRPDVMIFEDFQSREDANSKQISEDLETWMVGTAMKAKSPFGCTFIFVANMYPTPYSILKKLKKNPYWIKFIVGGILENGESLWEDLQPIAQLLKEYEEDTAAGHPEIFAAEVLNDEEATVNHIIDLSAVPLPPRDKGDIHNGNFIVIDPSNDKANSDAVAIGYFEVFGNTPVLEKLKTGRFSPLQTIETAVGLALENNCPVIFIESTAYQYSLKFWFNFVITQLNIEGLYPVDIYPGTKSKNTRIVTMMKAYSQGEISTALELRPEVHQEMRSFNPLKLNNVDNVLDLLTYAPKIITEFSEHLTAHAVVNRLQYAQQAHVVSVEQNSCF